MSSIKVSIIITAKNEAEHLEHCLWSLAELRAPFSYEVHVIDSHSQDASHYIAREFTRENKNFHAWRQKKTNCASARNFGAKKANGEILVFANSNCRFPATWLDELVRPLLIPQRFPTGAVGGFTEKEPRNTDELSPWERYWEHYAEELFRHTEKERTSTLPDFLPWAPARNFAVKKDLFLALGGFEEAWQGTAPDMDFCWRLALSGHHLAYAPKANILHKGHKNLADLIKEVENQSFYNQLLYSAYEQATRHHDPLLSKARQLWQSAKETKSLQQLSDHGLDSLFKLAATKGQFRALYSRIRPSEALKKSRQGICPEAEEMLPANFRYLHNQGYCYWQTPASYEIDGEMVLFQTSKHKWLHLDEKSRRVWEIKSKGGQSEDASEALKMDRHHTETLHKVDNLTLDLHHMDLLP